MEKLTYGDAVRYIREAVAENPDATNPMDARGLCLYTSDGAIKQKQSAARNCIVGTVLVKAGLPLPEREEGWFDQDMYDHDNTVAGACQEYVPNSMSTHTAMLLGRVQVIFDMHSKQNQTWGGTWGDALREAKSKGIL